MTRARDIANLLDASGDIVAGAFPATLPAVSGANLTGIEAFPTGWSAALDGSDMVFIYNSTEVFKITTAGAVVAADNVTAYGTP